ncbi:MAG: MCE family protein [Dietzia sp.]|nr:MCE family protein [Dietzia sp.]
MTGRRAVGAALLVVSTTTMSGCDWKGPNSLPLPGTAGGGPDGYSVTVQLADVTTLDRNARVRVGDVTVGRIADIRLGPGFAEVTVDPDGEVRLPRNATARVGQSSLLGASHLELSAPPGEPAEGTLSDGDLVPVERSGGYPTTEQTLATLAAALGGSGLAQAPEVFGELDVAMTPHRRGPGGGGTPQRVAHRARGAEGGHRGGVGVTGEALDRTRDPQRRGGGRGRRPRARTPGPRAAAAAARRGHPRGGHRHRDRGPCRRGLRR